MPTNSRNSRRSVRRIRPITQDKALEFIDTAMRDISSSRKALNTSSSKAKVVQDSFNSPDARPLLQQARKLYLSIREDMNELDTLLEDAYTIIMDE